MKSLLFVSLVLITVLGCLTPNKAVSFLKKKHLLDDTCAANYPSPIRSIDSSEYLESLKKLDSLMVAYEADSLLNEQEKDELRQNIKELLQVDTLPVECDSLCGAVYRYAAKNEREKNNLKAQLSELKLAIRNIKPIQVKTLDSAYVQTLHENIDEINGKNYKLEDKNQQQADEITEFKKNKKRPLVVLGWFGIALASQWWFWLVVVALGVYFFRGTIFKLLTKIFTK